MFHLNLKWVNTWWRLENHPLMLLLLSYWNCRPQTLASTFQSATTELCNAERENGLNVERQTKVVFGLVALYNAVPIPVLPCSYWRWSLSLTHSLSWHGRCDLEILIHFLFLIITSDRESSKFQPNEKTFKSADSSITLVDCLLEENHLGHTVFIFCLSWRIFQGRLEEGNCKKNNTNTMV